MGSPRPGERLMVQPDGCNMSCCVHVASISRDCIAQTVDTNDNGLRKLVKAAQTVTNSLVPAFEGGQLSIFHKVYMFI